MIIEEEYGNDLGGDMVIENYPNLQSIIVKANSLRYVNSLKICNCEKLKTIGIEDAKDFRTGAFGIVNKVIIESSY